MPDSFPLSHPSRVRGLKFFECVEFRELEIVAPFTGAWIEILGPSSIPSPGPVAPFTGAWIEIDKMSVLTSSRIPSHPSRVRGLKFLRYGDYPRP